MGGRDSPSRPLDRRIVYLLVGSNVLLAAFLARECFRTSAIERRLEEPPQAVTPVPRVVGVAAPVPAPPMPPPSVTPAGRAANTEPPAAVRPPADPGDELRRQLALAEASPEEARRLQEIFERHEPRARAAHERAEERGQDPANTLADLWREYCGEAGTVLTPAKLQQLGCGNPALPPAPTLGAPPGTAPPGPPPLPIPRGGPP